MVKRFVVLVAVLALMLAAVAPAAFAQDGISGPSKEVVATGVIRALDVQCNECAHQGITDEASGAVYQLLSDPSYPGGGVDLRDYVGKRVTIHGIPQTQSTGRSDILFVTRVDTASADGGSVGSNSNNGSSSAGSDQYKVGTSGATAPSSSASSSANEQPSGVTAAVVNGAKTLPSTGGILPIALIAGALLVGGGFLVRRLAR